MPSSSDPSAGTIGRPPCSYRLSDCIPECGINCWTSSNLVHRRLWSFLRREVGVFVRFPFALSDSPHLLPSISVQQGAVTSTPLSSLTWYI
ncbi:hypothetical protein PAXINDRAFT_17611 [Paxillus involutus ATCC 200175]|uniref:Uncharacterized protein n=1 Tax=Paxillus involutus ATCC 200175 TaxID=664439 RepID=A0A0C9TEB1_PAXIN|nr:hypothetical protein PAXINDRAFT_17611 [Paxillus involutus ATCC 200175]